MGEYVNSPNAMRVSEQMLVLNSDLRNDSGASPFGLVLYGILNDMVKRVVPDDYSKYAGQSAPGSTTRRTGNGSSNRDNPERNTVCPICGEMCATSAIYCQVCGKKLK